jgi:outer membrane protein OmpA-like peptidoglycan-associated protein
MKKLVVMTLLLCVSVGANAYLQECFYGMDCINGKVVEICDEACQARLAAEEAALRRQERAAAAKKAQQERAAAAAAERKAQQEKDAAALSTVGKVEQNDDEISVVLSNDILFEYGKANLSKESKKTLNQAVAILNKIPNRTLQIQGHTDSVSSDEHNMKLSQARAKAVYDYMMQRGLNISKVTYKGYGESRPVADNSTKEGRSANRRVEFRIK